MKINPYKGLFKAKKFQNTVKTLNKKEGFINTVLPPLESSYITGLYIAGVCLDPNIPKEQKRTLNIQNIICGVAGVTGGVALGKAVKKYENKIIHHLNKMKIPEAKKVTSGLRTLVPLFAMSLFMRFIIPVVSVPISSWARLKMTKEKQNIFDVKIFKDFV